MLYFMWCDVDNYEDINYVIDIHNYYISVLPKKREVWLADQKLVHIFVLFPQPFRWAGG